MLIHVISTASMFEYPHPISISRGCVQGFKNKQTNKITPVMRILLPSSLRALLLIANFVIWYFQTHIFQDSNSNQRTMGTLFFSTPWKYLSCYKQWVSNYMKVSFTKNKNTFESFRAIQPCSQLSSLIKTTTDSILCSYAPWMTSNTNTFSTHTHIYNDINNRCSLIVLPWRIFFLICSASPCTCIFPFLQPNTISNPCQTY